MKSLGKKSEGQRLERIQASPRFLDGEFRNVHPIMPSLIDSRATRPTLSEFLCGGNRRVPRAALPSVDPKPMWNNPPHSGLRATWLGHSTVLIEIDGFTLLTDPVWSLRASPSQLLGPKRFQPVPITIENLPHLDAVVISHDHYDHLDYDTIRKLGKRSVPFITSLGVGAHLQAWGIPAERIVELDWWESYQLPDSDIQITAAPSQHFSGRGLKDRNASLWSSLAIRSSKHSVFFSGDTGLTSEYEDIRKQLGPFDLVMLEVGAYHPSWGHVHLGPAHALEALDFLGGGVLLPVHWGTFSLALHAWDEPAETLVRLAETSGARLMMPKLGEATEPDHVEVTNPWWRSVDSVIIPVIKEESMTMPSSVSWPID